MAVELLGAAGVAARTPPPGAAWLELDAESKLLITATLVVEYANAAARDLIAEGDLLIGHGRVLRFGSASATKALAALVDATLRGRCRQRALLAAIGGDRWLAATAVPTVVGPDEHVLLTVHDIRLDRQIDPTPAIEAFGLSRGEAPILAGLLRARSPKEIADEAGISVHTVRAHIRSIFARANVHTTLELIRIAFSLSFIRE